MLSVMEELVDIELINVNEYVELSPEGRKIFEEALLEAKRRKYITYIM
ncbi:MAG: hypothetical protein QXI39_05985 [Candidatus Bathyarchaeia archaeon]